MQRLVLFARSPRAGRVKTRLVPSCGASGTLALYRAFLLDQLRLLRAFRSSCTLEVCLDLELAPDAELAAALGEARPTAQGRGDLGQRMLRCFRRAARAGSDATVIIGSDAPTLPRSIVERAFARLAAGSPAVLAPATDGGYVLLGLGRPEPALFRDVTWGGSEVARITAERARAAGLALALLAPWYDVVDDDGLARLRGELSTAAGRRRAPATARALARLDAVARPVV